MRSFVVGCGMSSRLVASSFTQFLLLSALPEYSECKRGVPPVHKPLTITVVDWLFEAATINEIDVLDVLTDLFDRMSVGDH